MANKSVIARNTLFLTLAHGASKFFSVLLTAIAARMLGTAGYGLYATGNALIEVGRIVAAYGLDYLVTREVASDPTRASRVASAAATVKMAVATVTYLLLIAVAVLLEYSTPVLHVVLILGVIIFLENLSDVADAVFQGRERMDFITRTLAISSASIFVCGAAALLLGLGLLGFVSGIAIGCLVRMLVGHTFLRRNFGRVAPSEVRGEEVRRLAKAGLPLLGATVFTLIFHRVDILMLGKMVDESQVGLYAAAVRVVDVVVLAPRILATAVYPALRKAMEQGKTPAVELMDQSNRVALVLCAGIALVVWIVAPYALRVITGAAFLPATSPLRILAWAIMLQAGCHMMARLLFAADREKDFLAIGALGMACNVALNSYWIPRMGIDGAALATLSSYGVVLGLYYLFAGLRGYRIPLWSSLVGPLLALGAAAAVSWWLLERGQWVASAGMVAAWIVVLLVLRVSSPGELRRGVALLRASGRKA